MGRSTRVGGRGIVRGGIPGREIVAVGSVTTSSKVGRVEVRKT